MAPIIAKLKKNVKFQWTLYDNQIISDIFENINQGITIFYPNFNKPFCLYTDASENGCGSILKQGENTVGLYSYKFNSPELNYNIMEKEFLAILKSFEHFKTIIFNSTTHVYTDNSNILCDIKGQSKRIKRWRVLLNEFDYFIEYIRGQENQATDSLSRVFSLKNNVNHIYDFKEIKKAQSKFNVSENKELNLLHIDGFEIYVDAQNRIFIPSDYFKCLFIKLHELLGHIGETKFYETFKSYIITDKFKERIHKLTQSCSYCQFNKTGKSSSLFTANAFMANHFNQKICSDILGPLNTKHFKMDSLHSKFYLVTFIDVYSRAIRVFVVYTITFLDIVTCFKNYVEEYGSPESILTDNGTQYISYNFRNFFKNNNIIHNLSPRFTPQSNGLAERINTNIGNILRIYRVNYIEFILSRIHNYHNLATHSRLGLTPFKAIHNYNYFDRFKVSIQKKKEIKIDSRLDQIRNTQKSFKKSKIKVQDLVLVKTHYPNDKLEFKYEGPFKVVQINKKLNTIEIENDDIKRIESLRNVKPYHQEEESVVTTKICLFTETNKQNEYLNKIE